MAIFTAAAVLLFKKFLLKGGLSLSASILKELSSNPQIAKALGRLAEDMGMKAGQDVIDFLLESFDSVGDLLGALVEFLDFDIF